MLVDLKGLVFSEDGGGDDEFESTLFASIEFSSMFKLLLPRPVLLLLVTLDFPEVRLLSLPFPLPVDVVLPFLVPALRPRRFGGLTSSSISKSSSVQAFESVVRSFSTEEALELSLETSMEESSMSPLPLMPRPRLR